MKPSPDWHLQHSENALFQASATVTCLMATLTDLIFLSHVVLTDLKFNGIYC